MGCAAASGAALLLVGVLTAAGGVGLLALAVEVRAVASRPPVDAPRVVTPMMVMPTISSIATTSTGLRDREKKEKKRSVRGDGPPTLRGCR